jgi:copper chaperone NosL
MTSSTFRFRPARRWLGGLALIAALGACSQAAVRAIAQDPADDTACALDGMVLKDFPGPKAQIHYAEGKPEFFCDLMELFGTVLAPEHKRVIAGLFVQDMGKADWDHPQGNWIDAKSAVYVVGSRKHGSMGPTIGSFARQEDAEAFAKKEGGKVLRFAEIGIDMISMHGGAAHDDKMSH